MLMPQVAPTFLGAIIAAQLAQLPTVAGFIDNKQCRS
jgi:hypothetical protein